MNADVYGEALSKRVQKLHNRSAIIVMNISNEVDHNIALSTLGWEPLKAQREKSKAKYILKELNKICGFAGNSKDLSRDV